MVKGYLKEMQSTFLNLAPKVCLLKLEESIIFKFHYFVGLSDKALSFVLSSTGKSQCVLSLKERKFYTKAGKGKRKELNIVLDQKDLNHIMWWQEVS